MRSLTTPVWEYCLKYFRFSFWLLIADIFFSDLSSSVLLFSTYSLLDALYFIIAKLFVRLVAPIVTLDQSIVKIAENERLALVCRVKAQPAATIQWTLKGPSANMEFQSFKDNPSLIIDKVEQYHSGKISCIATNKYGSTEAHATITVQC